MLQGGNAEQKFAISLKRLLEGTQTILDIGTSARFAKELRPYETWFEGKNYVAAGYNPSLKYGSYNCDFHQDIEALTFANEQFDAIICLEVLEHVRRPFHAVEELTRVLKQGGKLLLTTPFLAGYHGKGSRSQGHDDYPDFWRFTHEGLEVAFGHFKQVEVFPLDGPIEVRLKWLYLTRWLGLKPVRKLLDAVDWPECGRATSRHLLFGIK